MSTAIILPTGLFAGTPAAAGSPESVSDLGTKSAFDAFQGLLINAKNAAPATSSSLLQEGVTNKSAKELEDIPANPMNAALWAAFLPVPQPPLLLSADDKTLTNSFVANTAGPGANVSVADPSAVPVSISTAWMTQANLPMTGPNASYIEPNILPSTELHHPAATNVNPVLTMNATPFASVEMATLPDVAAISFTPDGQILPTLPWQASTSAGLLLNRKSALPAALPETRFLPTTPQPQMPATAVPVDSSSPLIAAAPASITRPSLSAETIQYSASIKGESITVVPSQSEFPKLSESIQLVANTFPAPATATQPASLVHPAIGSATLPLPAVSLPILQQQPLVPDPVSTPQPVAIPLTLAAQQPAQPALAERRSAVLPIASRARTEKAAASLPTQGKVLPSSISTSLPVSLVHATFQAKDSPVKDQPSANMNSLISSISDKARSSSAGSRTEEVAQTIQPAALTDAPISGTNSLSAMPLPTASTTPTLEAPVTHTLSHSVGTPEWGQSLGEHIVWLTDQNTQQARINLHPHGMGHMQVNVNLEQDRISLRFDVQHPAVAAAVQDSLPQLQTLLSQHGLTLGQASVSQQDAGQARQGAFARDYVATTTTTEGSEEPAPLTVARSRTGLIDDFA